jgi:hypothetical protein
VSLKLYMDVHILSAITEGLRRRGVDVLTSQEDGTRTLADPPLLDRATALGRVLFSQDEDLLREAVRRQCSSEPFAGVISTRKSRVPIGKCIDDLELLAKALEPEEIDGRVEYIPL